MTGYITPPQFDPHQDAIEGAPVDAWPPDPRLRDDRVKVGRRANWLVGDGPQDLSQLDDWDGVRPLTADIVLPRPVPARPQVDFEPVLLTDHGMYTAFQRFVILGSASVIVLACVGFGYWLRMVVEP